MNTMTSALPATETLEDRKRRARTWFAQLRDDMCAAFEALERDAPKNLYGDKAGHFVRTPWNRTDHTGTPGGGAFEYELRLSIMYVVGGGTNDIQRGLIARGLGLPR